MIWYSPKVFGKLWMELTGITMEQTKQCDMKIAMPKAFASTFVGTYVLALLIIIAAPETLTEGIILGVLLMLVLPVPMEINGLIWERRPGKLMQINVSHSLVTTLVGVVILMNWPF